MADTRAVIYVANRPVHVLPFQAIVWVNVAMVGHRVVDPLAPRLPAILDLGFNGTFAIREEQLREWAGTEPRFFRKLRNTQLRGAPSDHRLANLWLYRNRRNTREASLRRPFLLELHEGMVVMKSPEVATHQDHRPRLPLIGFRALHTAGLKVEIDCHQCRLSIRTSQRFPFFG